jgi:CysZ protein
MPLPDHLHGTWAYLEAHQWLWRTNRMKWLLWPFVCSLCLLPVYGYGVFWGTDALATQLTTWFGWQTDGVGYWVMLPFILVIVLLFGYILMKNIIMLLCTPLNALLADAVITDQLGEGSQQSLAEFWGSMWRAISMTVLGLTLGLLTTIGLLFLGSIPVVGTLAALVLGLMIQSFLAAWGFFDPVYERAGLGVWQSFTHSVRLTPRLISSGLPFVLLFQIPLVGWTLAPSYGTVAGAIAACRLQQQGRLTDLS